MGLFKTLFGKKELKKQISRESTNKNFSTELKISNIERLTDQAVKVSFEVPLLHSEKYLFEPGQYLNIKVNINGNQVKRSYSICSDVNEPLSVGIKEVEDGYVSKFFNQNAKVGQKVIVSKPMGDFTIDEVKGHFVGIAAGSGITPILSIAKMIQRTDGAKMDLIYGNRDDKSIMFESELQDFDKDKVNVTHIFSEQQKDGVLFGMMTEEIMTNYFKENLNLDEINGFYICGPEAVIIHSKNALQKLGVSDDKIHFELFTTPVSLEPINSNNEKSDFNGISQVTVILDEEEETFELVADGDTILEEAESYGMDAPYSCRGGICSTCKAKVVEGSAKMDLNYTLSKEEVQEGFILTCQAHPTSEKVKITYDI